MNGVMSIERVHGLRPFANLSTAEAGVVAGLMQQRVIPAGAILFSQGDRAFELYVIERGRARVERDGRLLALLGPGDIVGETGPINRGPRNATVAAETVLELAAVNAWDLARLQQLAIAAYSGFTQAA